MFDDAYYEEQIALSKKSPLVMTPFFIETPNTSDTFFLNAQALNSVDVQIFDKDTFLDVERNLKITSTGEASIDIIGFRFGSPGIIRERVNFGGAGSQETSAIFSKLIQIILKSGDENVDVSVGYGNQFGLPKDFAENVTWIKKLAIESLSGTLIESNNVSDGEMTVYEEKRAFSVDPLVWVPDGVTSLSGFYETNQ